ncbi:unnamed protein product [Rotaria sp. Silwood1]|nr:unnamed protein product [Rotaria sp. Silwood1]
MASNMTYCFGSLFYEINNFECLISRIIGSIILFVSIISLVFNIRFIYWSLYHRHLQFRHYSLVLSMVLSSTSVIIVIMPSVFIQCLSCHRLCSSFYCQLEGFVSYLNGCVHMFTLMMISIIRYITVFQVNIENRFIDQHSYWTVIVCWLLSLIFALPPLFSWNKYIPEGIGFHCGLNWFDRSLSSRIYIILAFAFIYFIPLFLLLIINLYVYCKIRSLLYGTTEVSKSNLLLNVSYQKYQSTSCSSSSKSSSTAKCEKLDFHIGTNPMNESSRLAVHQTRTFRVNYLMRLNRLQADQRFALATIFLVSEYLLSWTPYAVMALFYLFNLKYISQQSVLMTIYAFIAKISIILNPFIYLATVKTNVFKSILWCTDEARELKRMHEIPENINITETSTNNTDGLDDVVFDERYNDVESDDEENGLPRNTNGRTRNHESPSEEESNDEEEDGNEYYNPNRMPKKTGNLNAGNLLGSRKETGKGARNDRRQVVSGSDSDGHDDLAHI